MRSVVRPAGDVGLRCDRRHDLVQLFGAKRLRTIGSDLGGAVKGFKKAMDEGEENEKKQLASPDEKDADFDSTPASKTGGKSTHA